MTAGIAGAEDQDGLEGPQRPEGLGGELGPEGPLYFGYAGFRCKRWVSCGGGIRVLGFKAVKTILMATSKAPASGV